MISLLNLIVTAIIQCHFTAHPFRKVLSQFIFYLGVTWQSCFLNLSPHACTRYFKQKPKCTPSNVRLILFVCALPFTDCMLYAGHITHCHFCFFLHVECEMWNVIAACVARFYALSSANETTFLKRFVLLCRIFWMEFPCVN